MKILGIIAEYNPIHLGHVYHVEEAKRITGATHTICIVSGSFTQQGNPSVLDKFTKAQIAKNLGIDLVIELPTIYATSSAETFAYGAINILNSLGCVDYICFGSENGNIKEIQDVTDHTKNNVDRIDNKIKEYMQSGMAYTNARIKAIKQTYSGDVNLDEFFKSNNILALEYIRALENCNSEIIPYTIKRCPNFNISSTEHGYMSATGIRKYLYEDNIEEIKKYVPGETYNNIKKINLDKLYSIFRYKVISMDANNLAEIDEISEGLENRIVNFALLNTSYSSFLEAVITKRYTEAKIKRIIIKVLLNITKKDIKDALSENALYCRILAFNQSDEKLLSYIVKNAKIPVLVRFNDKAIANLSNQIQRYIKLDILATNLYNIIDNNPLNSDYYNKI